MKRNYCNMLLLLAPLVSGCMTSHLSEAIEKRENARLLGNDAIYGLNVTTITESGKSARRLSLTGHKYRYQLLSDGAHIAELLQQKDAVEEQNFTVDMPYAGFVLGQKSTFTSTGPVFINYRVSSRDVTEPVRQRLLAYGFKISGQNDDPWLSYKIDNPHGIAQPGQDEQQLATFLPVNVALKSEGTSFSGLRLLYPFTVIADVVTSPVQLVGYLIVANSVPSMKY